MSKHTAYFNQAPVDVTDYPFLAEKFKLPYEVVQRCVEALQETNEIPVMAFSGNTRDRVKTLAASLLTELPESAQDAPQEPSEAIQDAPDESISESPDNFSLEALETNFVDITDDFDPSQINESDEIVEHAAHGLMSAFSNSENCFILSEDGCCRINPESPPTLQHSLTVVSNVLKLKDLGTVVDDKSSWMLGSIVAALEDFHGEDFSISQVCDTTTQAYNTVATAVGVFKAFKNKRYNLSYSCHKEAHYAKIHSDPAANRQSQHLILHKAETYKIGPKSIRALCSIAKTMEDDTTIKNIRSQKQALDLIAAYKQAKVTYIVFDEGNWIRINGLAGEPPEGKIVINTKEWTAQVGTTIVPIPKTRISKS